MRNRKILLGLGLTCLIASLVFLLFFKSNRGEDQFVENNEEQESDAYDNPVARMEYELNMLKDPATGTIPEGVHEQELMQARQILEVQGSVRTMGTNAYVFQGPGNMGGRTRSIVYDKRFNGTTNRTILAGGVSGGVFKTTDNGASWVRKSPLNQLFSVTSIAQDPRPGFQDTWYYATGEAIGNSAGATGASYMGNGIYKSTDNGETWSRLANSNTTAIETFNARQDFIAKVIVDPDGIVYFAALDGIYRSADGGATWALVLSSGGSSINSGWVSDIVCTSTSPARFYASFAGTNNASPTNVPGVWTSTSGLTGSWTKIAGATAATNPATWNTNGTYRRIVLGLAPSNENILYALYDAGVTYPSIEAKLFKWNLAASTWTDLSANLPDEPGGSSGNDPFATQGGYNLVVAVRPDNENIVFIGGTNIYRSTDGFTSTANYTRIGGYATPSSYALYANSHSDIHSIVFEPGSNIVMLCGNDGGIQRTSDAMATTVSWTDISNNYQTYQYYYVALDPRSGNSKVTGGAQDNGTTRNIGGTGTNFERAFGGDGVSVGLSDVIGGNTYEFCGSQSGAIYRRNSLSGLGAVTNIRPSGAIDAGLFVTLFKLDDDNTQNIYYASDSSLYRNTSSSTANTSNWTKLTGVETTVVDGISPKTRITALTTTRGTYDPSTASLFIGTSEGRLYRLDDPVNATALTNPVNITGAGFTSGAYISSIAVNPRNDDTVMVTFSNYGVSSVFWTGNANSATPTWHNVEGALTLPSYRSSMITVANGSVEYFVGTSVGLYKATINAANPSATAWMQEGSAELGNAVISHIAYRPSDNRLLVGTHGVGMWATSLNQTTLPVTLDEFTGVMEKSTAMLNWRTSSEINTSYFEVQRSLDGLGYRTIGSVPAVGTSSQVQRYTLRDPSPNDVNYYRLKIVDRDGETRYSNIVVLRNTSVVSPYRVLRNPFRESIQIEFNRTSNNVMLQLFNSSGSLVASKRLVQPGIVNWQPGAPLPNGTYFLRVEVNGRISTQKLIHN